MGFQFLKDSPQYDLSSREGSRHPPREGDRSFHDSFSRDLLTHEHDLHIWDYVPSKQSFGSFSGDGADPSIHPKIHHPLSLHFLHVLFDL